MFGRLLNVLTASMYKTKWTHPLPRVDPTKPLQVPIKRWKIIKGDVVQIRSGNDKGKKGKILRVFRKTNMVIVNGANRKPQTKSNCGGIQEGRMESLLAIGPVCLFMSLMLGCMILLSRRQFECLLGIILRLARF